jgi:hypothetical protein
MLAPSYIQSWGNRMDSKKITERPKEGGSDVAYRSAKLVLAALPVLGSAAAEIFSTVIVPPIEKRRDEWIESVAQGLMKLEKEVEGLRIENLKDNKTFITVVMHASQVAIKNHQKEKLEALRNAVLNATSPNAPEEDLQLMFLNFVDSLTTWHLRVLKFLEDPTKYGEKHKIDYPNWEFGSTAQALHAAFPELVGQREFQDQLTNDLFARGLYSPGSLWVTVNKRNLFMSRTTSIGNQFIKFITSPID